MFQRGGNCAELDLELRAAPNRPHRPDRARLLAPRSHARPRRPARPGLAAGGVLDGDRARRDRAQFARRPARRRELLLHAHDAARDPRGSRATLLRRRSDGSDAPPAARDLVVRAAPGADAPAGRAAAVGDQSLLLAHPAPVRRGASSRLAARAGALRVLHVRLSDVGAGGRDAARRPPGSARAGSSATSRSCG